MKTQKENKKMKQSNFLKTWDKIKNDAMTWRGVAKTLKNVDDEIISTAAKIIFAKFEKDFKIYAKEKQNKRGFLSLYFGYLFLTKKAKEYNGADESILHFVKMIKKQDFEKKIEKQNKKVAEK